MGMSDEELLGRVFPGGQAPKKHLVTVSAHRPPFGCPD